MLQMCQESKRDRDRRFLMNLVILATFCFLVAVTSTTVKGEGEAATQARDEGLGQPGAPASISLVPTGQPTKRYWKKDDVALRQEIDTFSSLEDGQPAAPGDWEMELGSGWDTRRGRPDPALLEPTLKYTPHRYTDHGYEFFENAQLSLKMPLEAGNGEVAGNGDLTFGWQERWCKESGLLPTLATLAQVRIPDGDESSGADGKLTGIADKDLGPGTTYLNGWVKTANGDNVDDPRHFQWGFRTGYKWRVAEGFALVGDYVHQTSQETGHGNVNLLEFSAEFRTEHHLAFGPGLFVGLDHAGETPYIGAGFRFVYLFNARNPPP
jgi:hypothetical protein